MQITFLGTGTSSGVPMIGCYCAVCVSTDRRDRRLRSSVLIETEDTHLVIDTTPDFRYQVLRAGIQQLDAILFTHPHKDHIAGLDDVRPFNFFTKKPMPLYGNGLTIKAIQHDFHYAFMDLKYPGLPDLKLNIVENQPFYIQKTQIEPIQVMHHKMPVLGYRIGDFTYITDANFIEEKEKNKIRGSKILVINALRKEKHISHFTLAEAIELGLELGIEKVYFTHISHQMGKHEKVEKELPQHMFLAYDDLKIYV